MPYLPPSVARGKIDLVRAAAEAAGRDPDAFDYAYNVGVRIGGPSSDDPERQVAGEPDEGVERLLDVGFHFLQARQHAKSPPRRSAGQRQESSLRTDATTVYIRMPMWKRLWIFFQRMRTTLRRMVAPLAGARRLKARFAPA